MVRSNPALQAMNKSSQLSFIVVPDITVPGAFDDAVKGVSYIVHIASPIPSHEPEDGGASTLTLVYNSLLTKSKTMRSTSYQLQSMAHWGYSSRRGKLAR